jgi:hypothetical protein
MAAGIATVAAAGADGTAATVVCPPGAVARDLNSRGAQNQAATTASKASIAAFCGLAFSSRRAFFCSFCSDILLAPVQIKV